MTEPLSNPIICGCKYNIEARGDSVTKVEHIRCPTHAAAFEMKAALEEIGAQAKAKSQLAVEIYFRSFCFWIAEQTDKALASAQETQDG